ncbi:MAG: hypothetical protein WBL88_18315 [Nitrososphaeraceae archaeon]
MEKKIHIAVTIVVLAFGLIFATVGSVGSGHAQTNATSGASKTVNSAGGAMNKTAGNMTSAGGAAANKTGGNASSSNPVSKIPVIGPGLNKLFGGK